MLTTGLIMVLASFSYSVIIINDPPIIFPFADNKGERVNIEPKFGLNWYLNFFTGIVVIVLSVIILSVNYFFPRSMAVVFHHSLAERDEFFFVSVIYL